MRLFLLCVLMVGVSSCRRGARDDGEGSGPDAVEIPTGVFEVTRMTVSSSSCEDEGEEATPDVGFFTIDDAIRPGYRATTCGGDVEPDCPVRDSYVGESIAGGWQSLEFYASIEQGPDGGAVCRGQASLLRLVLLSSDEVLYETARWEGETADLPDACGAEAAQAMYEAGALSCVGHETRAGRWIGP